MSNLAGILNGSKVPLFVEITPGNYSLMGGQVSHSKNLVTESIDISSKNLPGVRCLMEGEGKTTADVSGEILFTSDSVFAFVLNAYDTKTHIRIAEKLGNAPVDPATSILVQVTSLSDNPQQNIAMLKTITFSSTESFSVVPKGAAIVGTPTAFTIDTSAETTTPFGIVKVNAEWWVSDTTTGLIYVYDSIGAYTGTAYDPSAQTNDPGGMTFDGVNVWVCGINDDNIYRFDTLGGYDGFSFSTTAGGLGTRSVVRDQLGFFWVVSASTGKVTKYTAAGVDTGIFFSVLGEDGAPMGIAYDKNYFWVVGANTDAVYQYDKDGVHTGFSFSVAGQDSQALDIDSDLINLFVLGSVTKTVYTYE